MRRLLLLCSFALLLCASEQAFAACQGALGAVPTITPTPLSVATTYDPGHSSNTVVTTTFTVDPAHGMSPPCAVYLQLLPNFSEGMTHGSSVLPYTIGGQIASAMSTGYTSAFFVELSPGISQTFTASMIIPARQAVPQGGYSDIVNWKLSASNGQQLNTGWVTFSASVLGSCALPAPNVSSLDFSAGIINGRVVQGYKLSALIQGASCSGASRLKLRGLPMATAGTVPASLDNRIHYQALARLGAVSTTLNTDTASEVFVPLGAASGTVSLDVSLLDKGMVQGAGAYSAVLSVILEPAN